MGFFKIPGGPADIHVGHDDGAWGTGQRKGQSTMNYLFIVRTWLQARFTSTERGASMVEYILLVALIALAVIGAVSFLGGQIKGTYNREGSSLSSAGS